MLRRLVYFCTASWRLSWITHRKSTVDRILCIALWLWGQAHRARFTVSTFAFQLQEPFFVTFSFTLLYQLVLLQIYVLDRGNSWMTISSNHVWSDHVAANGVDLTWFAPSVKYLTIKDGACENLTCTTNVIHLGYCFSAVRSARFAVTNKGQCAVTRCYFWFHQYTITKHEHNTNITFF